MNNFLFFCFCFTKTNFIEIHIDAYSTRTHTMCVCINPIIILPALHPMWYQQILNYVQDVRLVRVACVTIVYKVFFMRVFPFLLSIVCLWDSNIPFYAGLPLLPSSHTPLHTSAAPSCVGVRCVSWWDGSTAGVVRR